MPTLWQAYTQSGDATLIKYADDLHTKYFDGELPANFDHVELMRRMKAKFDYLVSRGTYGALSPEQEQIIALKAELEQVSGETLRLSKKIASQARADNPEADDDQGQDNEGNHPNKRGKQRNRKDRSNRQAQNKDEEWKKVPLKPGELETRKHQVVVVRRAQGMESPCHQRLQSQKGTGRTREAKYSASSGKRSWGCKSDSCQFELCSSPSHVGSDGNARGMMVLLGMDISNAHGRGPKHYSIHCNCFLSKNLFFHRSTLPFQAANFIQHHSLFKQTRQQLSQPVQATVCPPEFQVSPQDQEKVRQHENKVLRTYCFVMQG